MTINATREHWESLTDARRPKRDRSRREIRRGRRHELFHVIDLETGETETRGGTDHNN